MSDLGMADQTHLATWADRTDSPTEFPRLIRRLILETAPGVVELGMPAGQGVSSGGWDGSVKATAANAWIPVGLSLWELSVNSNPGKKSDDDYSKRDTTPDGSDLKDCVYIAGILRRWTKRGDWAKARTAENKWKTVRAYGLDDVEAWLEDAPVTRAWLSEKVGLNPYGFRSAEAWWDSWSNRTTPPLPADLVASGRHDIAVKLTEFLAGDAGVLTIAGDSADDVRAFIVSTLLSSTDGGSALAKTAFVDELASWRTLSSTKRPLALVPSSNRLAQEIPTGSPHHVLVPVGNAETADIRLPPIAIAGAVEALKTAGMDDAKADEAARLGRRSLMALRRNLATNRALFEPAWAKRTVLRAVRSALLLGSWSTVNPADLAVVAALSGTSHEEFLEDLGRSSQADDPLLAAVGESMHLVSPVDAWLLLRGAITTEDLARIKTAVGEVLGERDPALDLSIDNRWRAGLDGKTRAYSSDLRDGLSRTLTLLGVNGQNVRASSTTNGSDWASFMVRDLLDAANGDTSGGLWASLTDVLPALGEAAPDVFVGAVTTGLRGQDPLLLTMFETGDGGAFSGTSPHTGLLWALEGLAWSPAHFGAAVEVLAQLAEIDPGGRTMNRPAASLASIFCPWHPENSVTVDRRLAAVDGVRARHSDVAWLLMQSMLPQTHATQFPTSQPKYRDWVPTREPVLAQEYLSFLGEIVDRLIEDVGVDVARWSAMVERMPDLVPADRAKAIEQMQSLIDVEKFTEAEASELWKVLRKTIDKHREFHDAHWTLPSAQVDRIERLADGLKPSGSFDSGLALFTNRMPHVAGVSRRVDRDDYQTALRSARAAAIGALDSENDPELLRRLIDEATVHGVVGVALADATGNKHEAWMQSALGFAEGKEVDAAWSYFAVRFQSEGWAVLDPMVESPSVDSLTRARLLLLTREFPLAWERAEAIGEDVNRQFWLNFQTYGLGHDFGYVEFAAERLMSVGRNGSALDLLNVYTKQDGTNSREFVELVLQGMQELQRSPSWLEIGTLDQYAFTSLFGLLEQRVDEIDADALGTLEWYFLPVLGHDTVVPTLHRRLATHPRLFVEVLSMLYLPRGGQTEELSEDEAARRAGLATNGYRLLVTWKWPPGFDGTQIDPAALKSWLDEVQRLLRAADRYEVGMSQIGQVLASAPPGTDGSWPAQAVRDVLESAQSEELERGLQTQVYNDRGVTSRGLEDGGLQEQALVAKYLADAESFADRWPVTARILRNLARSYDAESRRSEQSAERFRQGLDG